MVDVIKINIKDKRRRQRDNYTTSTDVGVTSRVIDEAAGPGSSSVASHQYDEPLCLNVNIKPIWLSPVDS